MAEKTFRFTVDVESDWGGRSEETQGIKIGLPKILKLFHAHNIRGLFFISTELIKKHKEEIKDIKRQGHEIGSHGHFHLIYNDKWRAEQDQAIANTLLLSTTGTTPKYFRAPKFSQPYDDSIYSVPNNHIGLLKSVWFDACPDLDSILYLHPFDLVGGTDAPDLFSRIWYSRPKAALRRLEEWATRFSGSS
jgi:hypothetical protein